MEIDTGAGVSLISQATQKRQLARDSTRSVLLRRHTNHWGNGSRALKDHGLRLRRKKCTFYQDSVQYLGHSIDCFGIHTGSRSRSCTYTNMCVSVEIVYGHGKLLWEIHTQHILCFATIAQTVPLRTKMAVGKGLSAGLPNDQTSSDVSSSANPL